MLLSTITTPYKDHVICGYDGWYMGLVVQTGFVLIYFMISRYWNWDSGQLGVILISAFIIFALGVMMKFRVDPLEMYVNLDEQYVENFLKFIGFLQGVYDDRMDELSIFMSQSIVTTVLLIVAI